MEYDVSEIMRIVRFMLGDDATGVYINTCEYSWGERGDIISEITDDPWLVESTGNISVYRGATKVVFVPKDKKIPYVIKLVVTGIYSSERDEEDPWYSHKNVTLIRESECDILDMENAMIENMGEEVAEFIKPNIYVGEYNGISVYIQEKVRCTQEQLDNAGSCAYTPKDTRKDISDGIDRVNDKYCTGICWEFLYNMIEYYGEETVKEMLELLEQECVYDLHEGNYGYDYSGRPVLIDIGGYDSQYFWKQPIN